MLTDEVNGGFVRIVFRRAANGDDSVNDRVNEKSKEKIKEKSKEKIKEKTLDKVYRLISENSKITTVELAELCGVGENSIYKTVRKLRVSGRKLSLRHSVKHYEAISLNSCFISGAKIGVFMK